MSEVTSQGIINILIGTELEGRKNIQYHANLAVPNSILEKTLSGNNSGFSFGVVQLDIGNNLLA